MRKATLATSLVAALLLSATIWAAPLGPGADRTSQDPVAIGTRPEVRVDMWTLYRSSGAELYQELCASCHGSVEPGGVPAVGAPGAWAPDLTELAQRGIPRRHWAYVITSPCDDHHHWAASGAETMPCWSRIFRWALNDEDAPLLISKKVVGYLADIQH